VDFTEAEMMGWQWHQPNHQVICTSLQTHSHASSSLQFFTGQILFLLPNRQCQSNEGKENKPGKLLQKLGDMIMYV